MPRTRTCPRASGPGSRRRASSQEKVAGLLLEFFTGDPTSRPGLPGKGPARAPSALAGALALARAAVRAEAGAGLAEAGALGGGGLLRGGRLRGLRRRSGTTRGEQNGGEHGPELHHRPSREWSI